MAKFQKGDAKPVNSGRKKGSLNKKRVPKVADFLAEQDINPAEKILEILEDPELSSGTKCQIWLDLLSYCQAKPKDEVEDDDLSEEDQDLLDHVKGSNTKALLKIVKDIKDNDGAS